MNYIRIIFGFNIFGWKNLVTREEEKLEFEEF